MIHHLRIQISIKIFTSQSSISESESKSLEVSMTRWSGMDIGEARILPSFTKAIFGFTKFYD